MKFLKIDTESIENGPGIRIAVFFAGCLPNKCKAGNCPGCHNKIAQSFDTGDDYSTEIETYILDKCNNIFKVYFKSLLCPI